MTEKELENSVRVGRASGYNSYTFFITYRGKEYKCHSNNSILWDNYHSEPEDYIFKDVYKTRKQVLHAIYDEVKRKNYLGEYIPLMFRK